MEILQKIEKHCVEVLEELGIAATISTEIKVGDEDKKYIKLDIEGAELGELIGYHGAVLDSLQNILSLMVSDDLRAENLHLMVDVNKYRDERIEYIRSIAKKAILNVKENNQEVALSPMKPFERRIVHIVAKEENMETESAGEGEERYVVIKP